MEVVGSNPSSSVYTNNNNVNQVAKSSVTVSCKSKQINRPTCSREGTPVTGKYKTQRSGSVTKQPASSYGYSSAHFCIPVTNRFEYLSVADENSTDIQTDNSNENPTPNYSLVKNEFESSNLIESQCANTLVMNLSNTPTKKCVNTRQLGAGCRKVNTAHKQPVHVGNNSKPLSQNSTSKISG